MSECRVYVMVQCFDTVTKIGITTNLKSRLAAVNTGSPLPVAYVCASTPMSRARAREVEAALHHDFADCRMNGEWFSVNPFVVQDHMARVIAGRPE